MAPLLYIITMKHKITHNSLIKTYKVPLHKMKYSLYDANKQYIFHIIKLENITRQNGSIDP